MNFTILKFVLPNQTNILQIHYSNIAPDAIRQILKKWFHDRLLLLLLYFKVLSVKKAGSAGLNLKFPFCHRTLPRTTKKQLDATEKQLLDFELLHRAKPFLRVSRRQSSTNALSTRKGFESLTDFCWVKPICQNSSEIVLILPKSNKVRHHYSSSTKATTKRITAR